jgi:hypothetical protein
MNNVQKPSDSECSLVLYVYNIIFVKSDNNNNNNAICYNEYYREHDGCITAVTCTSVFHLPEEGR